MTPNNTGKQVGIQGVVLRHCRRHSDARGSFTEVFRTEWSDNCNYHNEIQLNLSRSIAGALRGLHFHHRQHDWWIPVAGKVQAVLTDLRTGSPTFMNTESLILSWTDSLCLLVPPGVAHGFLAIEDVTLMYAVDRYYDGSDEQGVLWNDPELAVDWQISEPILSQRDRSNPTVDQLRQQSLLPLYSSQS